MLRTAPHSLRPKGKQHYCPACRKPTLFQRAGVMYAMPDIHCRDCRRRQDRRYSALALLLEIGSEQTQERVLAVERFLIINEQNAISRAEGEAELVSRLGGTATDAAEKIRTIRRELDKHLNR